MGTSSFGLQDASKEVAKIVSLKRNHSRNNGEQYLRNDDLSTLLSKHIHILGP